MLRSCRAVVFGRPVEALPHSPVCWICGDLHIENFGSYKGDNRLVYFDLNDFDESILAPVSSTSPILIAIVMHIANNKKIMKEHTNGKLSNILGFLTLLIMTVAAIVLIYFQIQ